MKNDDFNKELRTYITLTKKLQEANMLGFKLADGTSYISALRKALKCEHQLQETADESHIFCSNCKMMVTTN